MAKQPVTEIVVQAKSGTYRRVKNDGSLGDNRPVLSARARAARMRRDAEALRQADVGLFLQTVEAIAGQAAAVGGVPAGADHPLAKILGRRKGDPMLDVWAANVEAYRAQQDENAISEREPSFTASSLWPETMRHIENIRNQSSSDDEG